VRELERWLRRVGRIGTVSGRYYAMDRDTRWERTKLGLRRDRARRRAAGARRAEEAVTLPMSASETDEFIRPTVIGDYDGSPTATSVLHSTSARTGPPADPRPGRPGVRRVSTRRRPVVDLTHD
jgi:bisphosphoglycerate-independent phosphoglycerate mutase (AlkP superfamily)